MQASNVYEAQVLSRISAIIAERTCTDVGLVRPQSRLVEDLGIDSLSLYDVLLEWETSFSVVPAPGAVAGARTLADLVAVLVDAAEPNKPYE